MFIDTSWLTQLLLKALRRGMQSPVFRKIVKFAMPVFAIIPALFSFANWASFENIGIVNLFQALQLGLPWWLIFVPFFSLITFLMLLIFPHVRGKYTVTVIPSILVPALIIASAWSIPRALTGFLGMGISFFVGSFYALFAMMLDYYEPPVSLNEPFARFSYLGRYDHLITLQNMAKTWHWEFRGPFQEYQTVVVRGVWKNRDFYIHSSNVDDPPQMVMRIGMYSSHVFPSVVIIGGSIPVVGEFRKMATLGKIRNSRGMWIPIFLPDKNNQVPASYFDSFKRLLENRRQLIDIRSRIDIRETSVSYERTRSLSMSADENEIRSIFDLLNELCSLLERLPSTNV